MNEFHCPSSAAQARISHAVSSAYETHCYDQGYYAQSNADPGYDMQCAGVPWCQNGTGYIEQAYSQPCAMDKQQSYGECAQQGYSQMTQSHHARDMSYTHQSYGQDAR